MQLHVLTYLVSFILLADVMGGGCKGKKYDKPTDPPTEKPVEVTVTPAGKPNTSWPISKAWIEGDVLHLALEYNGCKKRPEDFSLFWDGTLLKSNPPGIYVALRDKLGPQSSCKMIVEDELTFDLKALNYPKPCVIMIDKHSVKYGND